LQKHISDKGYTRIIESISSDILRSPKGVYVILSQSKIEIGTHIIDYLTVTCFNAEITLLDETVKDIHSILSEKLGLSGFRSGTPACASFIDELKKESKKSASGKVLEKFNIKKIVEFFIEEDKKKQVVELADFPLSSIPPDYIKDELELEDTFIKKLIESNILSKMMSIECKKCGKRRFPFYTGIIVTPEKGKDFSTLLNKGMLHCPSCGVALRSDNISFLEVLSLNGDARELIRGGVWLEGFVLQVLLENGIPEENIINSVYIGRDEIDLITGYNTTILFECKDKTLGQNDLYILGTKASHINPELVVIVTTQEIPKDILDIIQRMREEAPYEVQVISGKIEKIKNEVQKLLLSVNEDYLIDHLESVCGVVPPFERRIFPAGYRRFFRRPRR
jgi:hypothetical protein